MPVTDSGRLTKRQRDVMERIDRRMPIKVIAQDLGMSETRVNQHIRALKDIYGTSNLNELVEVHRKASGLDRPDDADLGGAASAHSLVERSESLLQDLLHADAGALGGDAGALAPTQPHSGEPTVVQKIFDGPNGTIMRLLAIVGIAIGIIGVFFLVTAVSVELSDRLGTEQS